MLWVTWTVWKVVGAVLAFAAGIWIGLGMPGWRKDDEARRRSTSDRLNATWMNRMFFKLPERPRRFGEGGFTTPPEGDARDGFGDEGDDGLEVELAAGD